MAHCKSVADFSLSFTSVNARTVALKTVSLLTLNFCLFFSSFYIFNFDAERKERRGRDMYNIYSIAAK